MNQNLSPTTTNFIEIPFIGKHSKIQYEGHILNFDRVTPKGKNFWRCKRRGCNVSLN